MSVSIVNSGKWSAIDRVGKSLLRMLVQVLLARALLPEDFGVVAAVMAIMNVANVFVQGGISTVVIQLKDLSREDASSAFWVNLFLGLAFFASSLSVLHIYLFSSRGGST